MDCRYAACITRTQMESAINSVKKMKLFYSFVLDLFDPPRP